jgi:hypothetical protein
VRLRALLASALLGLASAAAQAAVVWNESVSGDLSNDGQAPTSLGALAPGSNVVLGSAGLNGQNLDRDFFSFNVPTGAILRSIMVQPNTTVFGNFSFLGIAAAPQISEINLLSFLHYGPGDVGTDILPALTASGTLPSGVYSVWVQDTGGPVVYGFDFVLQQASPVPLPGAAALFALGLAGLGGVSLRRRR